KNMKWVGPNQLWVADITYVTIATGFVYLAAILDAWSRRVVGYAISRSIDARLAVAALKAAISPQSTKGLCASFRPWVAVCLRRLSRRLAKARSHRLHGPAWQSRIRVRRYCEQVPRSPPLQTKRRRLATASGNIRHMPLLRG